MQNSNIKTVPFIFLYLWKKNSFRLRFFFLLSLVFLIFSKAANAFIPFAFKYIFDSIEQLSKANSNAIQFTVFPLSIVVLYVGLKVVAQILNELKEATFVLIEQSAVKRLALEAFSHLLNLSLRFHLNRKTGEITKAIERGIKAIEMIVRFSTFNIIPTFFEIIFVCILLAIFYPIYYMATIALTLVLYSWYTISVTEWRTKYIRMMKMADNKSGYKAVDSLLNYETVKYFNNEKYEIDSYAKLLENYRKLAVKNRIFLSFLNLGQGFIIAFGLATINILAIKNIFSGSAMIGDFALVNAYILQLYQPLANLGFSYREIKLAYIDIENLRLILSEESEVKDKKDAKNLILTDGDIEFWDVSFHYNEDREILKNISFKISAGKTTAIVGKSGSGKSTIARLLFRFYDVTNGVVKIDGQDISSVTKKSVHSAIGVVPQDTVLFNETIFYNIAYGNPQNTTKEDIIRVAKLAYIHDFIETLPEKYQTIVGERGLKLSGGEKQRVAIARLLLKNPKIFILDEATSSLDTKTEKSIQESIKNASYGHTSIIIAHRLSTVVDADEIIVLADGKIAERGDHFRLLQKNGLYFQMWENQKSNQE